MGAGQTARNLTAKRRAKGIRAKIGRQEIRSRKTGNGPNWLVQMKWYLEGLGGVGKAAKNRTADNGLQWQLSLCSSPSLTCFKNDQYTLICPVHKNRLPRAVRKKKPGTKNFCSDRQERYSKYMQTFRLWQTHLVKKKNLYQVSFLHLFLGSPFLASGSLAPCYFSICRPSQTPWSNYRLLQVG